MTSRQFTLRGLVGFTGVIALASGLAVAGDPSTPWGIVLIAIAARIAAIVVVGALVGLCVGSISKALAAAAIGVLLADVTWVAFLVTTFSLARENALQVVLNPIVVLALIACPPAAAKSLARALAVGISLSILLPSIVAAMTLLWMSICGGTGLGQALTVIIAALGIATGIVGTLAARGIFELLTWSARRRSPSDARTLPAKNPSDRP